ncbi:hypothetical protein ONZ45_g12424 [Pleurotus djamor]|nr:hypothetical protein ONZ45_g12424 [Pleurotus djamor]
MYTTSTDAPFSSIHELPPEILTQVFLYSSTTYSYTDSLPLCLICKSWLPSAQAALYQSIILFDDNVEGFSRTIEENKPLARLMKQLTFSDGVQSSRVIFVTRIFQALIHYQTVVSFHLPAGILPHTEHYTAIVKLLPSLHSLRHLTIDVNVFPSMCAVKGLISSFSHLLTLEVHDQLCGDFSAQWYSVEISEAPLDFPNTIRSLELSIPGAETLDAFLRWIQPNDPNTCLPIQRFRVDISHNYDASSLGSLVRSFSTNLKSLTLVYSWPSGLSTINLSKNINLHSFTLQITVFRHDADRLRQHLSSTLETLSSPSLRTIEVKLSLIGHNSPQYDFLDWGLLDKAAGNACIRVFVACDERGSISHSQVFILLSSSSEQRCPLIHPGGLKIRLKARYGFVLSRCNREIHNQPGDLQLPFEIVHLIVTHYAHSLDDRRPIRHLLLVSHEFHSLYIHLLYESLYLTDRKQPESSQYLQFTAFSPHQLPNLHTALSANSGFANLIHTVFFDFYPKEHLTHSQWATVKLIFPYLTNLTRLSMPPPMGIPWNLLASLQKETHLTHFASGSFELRASLVPLLRNQPSLQYLSFPIHADDWSIFSYPCPTWTHLHTVHCSQDAFSQIHVAQLPSLRHVVVIGLDAFWRIPDEELLHPLRTLQVNCEKNNNFFVLMRSLRKVEYIFTGNGHIRSIEECPLPALLEIPSPDLKYICLRTTQSHREYTSTIHEHLFNAHTSLVVIDIHLSGHETAFIVDRHIKFARESKGGFEGGVEVAVMKGFRVPKPHVFKSWWEVSEIQGDVEDVCHDVIAYCERHPDIEYLDY